MFGSLISLIRPYQWVKNIFVLMPLFFGGRLLNYWCWEQAIITFVAFSLMASAIYCLNDLKDIEADRMHPTKRNRPLASGKIQPLYAVVVMCILSLLSLGLCLFLKDASIRVGSLIFFYMCLNIAYCYFFKKYAIIDVFIISFGFVLRLLAGGVACDIWLSPWIVLMTFLLALFLAFAKRRDDVVLMEKNQIVVRKNVSRYNSVFLNQTLGIVGAITIVCYIMYSVSPEVIDRFSNGNVYITSVFVLAALLRYLQVTIVDLRSGSPTKILLHDRFIQFCILLWISAFTIILYV